eukprot:TRINITY_DN1522_c1_g1_i4.p1 TRINITY_DN1522_c1_g1~~TRINITY_DN1522_c1_g1_i4.p1  ORF type:complete len:1172 (-),score=326.21 TRINITY_DN1522_c1_g1_i4:1411-4926(-)
MGSACSSANHSLLGVPRGSRHLPPRLAQVLHETETLELVAGLVKNNFAESVAAANYCVGLLPHTGTGLSSFARMFLPTVRDMQQSLLEAFPSEPVVSLVNAKYVCVDLGKLSPPAVSEEEGPTTLPAALQFLTTCAVMAVLQPHTRPPTWKTYVGSACSSLEDQLAQLSGTASLFLHVDNIQAVEERKYSEYFLHELTVINTEINGVQLDSTAAQRHVALWRCIAPALSLKRVHTFATGSTLAPLCARYGMVIDVMPSQFLHVMLDPLWPQSIRKSAMSTGMLNSKLSVLEGLGLTYSGCKRIFEYTAGDPAAVHQTFCVLAQHKQTNLQADLRDDTALERVLADIVSPQLLARGHAFAKHAERTPPASCLPLITHLITLSTLGFSVELSKPIFIGEQLIPLVYWLDYFSISFCRATTQDTCVLVWPLAVVRHWFKQCSAAIAPMQLPYWTPNLHDPAVMLLYPLLRNFGALYHAHAHHSHSAQHLHSQLTSNSVVALNNTTGSDREKAAAGTKYGDIFFWLRETVLATVPFSGEKLQELFKEEVQVSIDSRMGKLIALWKRWPHIHMYTVAPPAPATTTPTTAIGAGRGNTKTPVTGRGGRPDVPPLLRLPEATESGQTGGVGGSVLPAQVVIKSSWQQRDEGAVGMSGIRGEVEAFTARVQGERIKGNSVLVIVCIAIKERLAKLFNQDGYLYIPPGTHGISKATGKLKSLTKTELEKLRARHKHKAAFAFADKIERARKVKNKQNQQQDSQSATGEAATSANAVASEGQTRTCDATSAGDAVQPHSASTAKAKLPLLDITKVVHKEDADSTTATASTVGILTSSDSTASLVSATSSRRGGATSKLLSVPGYLEVVIVSPAALEHTLGVHAVSTIIAVKKGMVTNPTQLHSFLTSLTQPETVDPSWYITKSEPEPLPMPSFFKSALDAPHIAPPAPQPQPRLPRLPQPPQPQEKPAAVTAEVLSHEAPKQEAQQPEPPKVEKPQPPATAVAATGVEKPPPPQKPHDVADAPAVAARSASPSATLQQPASSLSPPSPTLPPVSPVSQRKGIQSVKQQQQQSTVPTKLPPLVKSGAPPVKYRVVSINKDGDATQTASLGVLLVPPDTSLSGCRVQLAKQLSLAGAFTFFDAAEDVVHESQEDIFAVETIADHATDPRVAIIYLRRDGTTTH